MVIPGLPRQRPDDARACSARSPDAGYRVTGWGMGLNTGVTEDIVERIAERVERFGSGRAR